MNKQVVSIETVGEMAMDLKSGEYILQVQEDGVVEGAVTGREILKYLKSTKSNEDYENFLCTVVGTADVRRMKELYKKEPRQGKFNGSRNKSSESSKLTAVLYTRAEQKVLHKHCFAFCTNLTHIHLPENLDFVAGTSFLGCTNLSCSVDKLNQSFSTDSSGKLLLSHDGKILHAYP